MANNFMQSMINAANPDDVMNAAKGNELKTLGTLLGIPPQAVAAASKAASATKQDPSGDYITDAQNAAKGAVDNAKTQLQDNIDKVKTVGQKLYNTGARFGKAIY